MIGLSISTYVIHSIHANMDSFINTHNLINSVNNHEYITSKSIEDIILILEVTNYICIFIIISIITLITSKLYLKNIKLSSILGVKINNGLKYYINKILCLLKRKSVIYI